MEHGEQEGQTFNSIPGTFITSYILINWCEVWGLRWWNSSRSLLDINAT